MEVDKVKIPAAVCFHGRVSSAGLWAVSFKLLHTNKQQDHMPEATGEWGLRVCMCVQIFVCFKGIVSLARLANYSVLQAVMRGDGKGLRKRGKGLHLKVSNKKKKNFKCKKVHLYTNVPNICGQIASSCTEVVTFPTSNSIFSTINPA